MFSSISELISLAEHLQLPISEIVLRTEIEQTGRTRQEILEEMTRRYAVMRRSIKQGISKPIHTLSGMTKGDAFRFNRWLNTNPDQCLCGGLLGQAVARSLAVGEVNASMGCIVATPTAGSAGILPAVLTTLQDARSFSDESMVSALFTASGVGIVIMNRAHVSGAAGGCQAETGSAAAMTAAGVVELLGGSPRQSAHAAALALTNMLGLVCDPIAGLVEVPCIKRNAAAVGQAFIAADLAMAGIESLIPADEVIDAMERIGTRMDERLRETAQGGLAASPTGKKLAASIWNRMDKKER